MGTRNLTAVFIDGEYKIAQYGQWDGYPEGQGLTTLTFLRGKMNLEQFKTALRNSTYISNEELNNLWKQYGEDDSGFVTIEVLNNMKKDHPEFSRDTGAEILYIVQDHPEGMKLQNNIDFAANSIFCEWAWVVDLDEGTFEGYQGFNEEPLTKEDRFYFLRDKEKRNYHSVRLVARWILDELPTDGEFLAAFQEDNSFTAVAYEDDTLTIADMATFDTVEEAIEFAEFHNWDEVVNDTNDRVIYRR